MIGVLQRALFSAALLISPSYAFPQSSATPAASNDTALSGGNSISFETTIIARLAALRPAVPDLEIKYILLEPWEEEPSSDLDDFQRIRLLYYTAMHDAFMETIYDPWKPDSWSNPVKSDYTWSNCKPYKWGEVESLLYGQMNALRDQGITDRKYTSMKLQRLRYDFWKQEDQIYWIWEESEPVKNRKFWQGDRDHRAYGAFDVVTDAGVKPAGQGVVGGNGTHVEDITATA